MRSIAIALVVVMGSAAGCDEGQSDGPPAPARGAELPDGLDVPVERVVDGDTIRVTVEGQSERVRYIGIDTPETHHPERGREPWGPEATEANRRLVEGRTVRLVFDTQERDHYGRLLAYVYLPDGTFVNAKLVEDGFARVLTVPPNVRHQERFQRLAREAREGGRGLWSDR